MKMRHNTRVFSDGPRINSRNQLFSNSGPKSEGQDNDYSSFDECLAIVQDLSRRDLEPISQSTIESINKIKYFLMSSDSDQSRAVLDKMSMFKSSSKGTVGDIVVKTRFYAEHSDHFFIYQEGQSLYSVKVGSFNRSTGRVFVSGNVDCRKLSKYMSDIVSGSYNLSYFRLKDNCDASNYHHSSFEPIDKPKEFRSKSSGSGMLVGVLFIIFLIIVIACCAKGKY